MNHKKLIKILCILLIVLSVSIVNSAAENDPTVETLSIKLRAFEVAKDVNTYLQEHPDMTVKDLQNDPDFTKIAIQPVGDEGYTALVDYDTMIIRFHPQEKLNNMDTHDLEFIFPELWDIISKSEGGKTSSGYYLWEDPDGSIREKYNYQSVVETKTADGVGFIVSATTYVDRNESTEDTNANLLFAKESIKQKAQDVAKQIEIFLRSNPTMTVKDLQNDTYFQNIAVQLVGKTGYTAITDYNTLICRFHSNPAIVDMDLHNLAEKLPGFWSIMEKTQGGITSEGLYDWLEANGSTTQKYMYIAIVDAKTADGVGFSVAATTYQNEYDNPEGLKKVEEDEKDVYIEETLKNSLQLNVHDSKDLFYNLENQDIVHIKDLISKFLNKKEPKKLFIDEDRDGLYNLTIDLFNENKERYGLTHFYFHRIDGTNFLRVHNKDIYDDELDRITFEKSKESGSWGSGIELGQTAFALRVVHPYFSDENTLIGYVEFGEEISHLLQSMKEKTGFEYSIIVKKEFIDEDKWKSVTRVKGIRDNYDDIDDYVNIESTDFSGKFLRGLYFHTSDLDNLPIGGELLHTIKIGNKYYSTGGFPLIDAGGNNVGVVLVIQDITSFLNSNLDSVNFINWSYIILGLLGILIYYFLLSSLSKAENSNLKQNFILFIYASIFMLLSYLSYLYSTSNTILLISQRVIYTCAFLFVYLFSLILVDISGFKLFKTFKRIVFFYVVLISGLVLFTDKIIKNVIIQSTEFAKWSAVNGDLYHLITFSVLIFLIFAFYIFVKRFKREEKLNVFIPVIIGIVIIVLSNILYYMVFSLEDPYLLIISPIVVNIIIGYSFSKLGLLKLERNTVVVLLGIVLIAIIMLFLFQTYKITDTIEQQGINDVSNHLVSIGDLQENIINRFIDNHVTILSILGAQQEITQEELLDVKLYLPSFERIFVIDSDGIIKTSTVISVIGMDEKNSKFFIDGKSQSLVDFNYHPEFSFDSNKKSLLFSIPHHGGVLIAIVNISSFSDLFTSISGVGQTAESIAAYINKDGDFEFLTKSKISNTVINTISKDRLDIPIAQALSGKENIFLDYNDYRDVTVIAVTNYLPSLEVGIVTKIDKEEAMLSIDMANRKIWVFTIIMIVAIVSVGLVFNVLLTRSLRNEIVNKTKELEKFNEKLETTVRQRTQEVKNKSRELEILNLNLASEVNKKTKELQKKLDDESETTEAMVYILERANKTNLELEKSKEEMKEKNELLRKQSFITTKTNKKLLEVQEKLKREKAGVEKKVDLRTSEIRKLLKLKTDFVNQLSHDLRTPLTPLITFLPILSKKAKDAESKKTFEMLIRNTGYLRNLVTKTLDLSRLESGTVDFEFTNLEFSSFIKDLLADWKQQLQEAGIKIKNDVTQNFVCVDVTRIKEVIDNLLTNAKKYMGKGTVTIGTERKGNMLIVSFADTGKGMTKEQIASIFNEFYKADDSRHDLQSYGLGMAITKKIIEKHGGKIWAESDGLGKGSTFKFSIKLVKPGK